MNDGLFEVTLITNPKNPLELQEIMTALLTAEDNTDLIYSFKSAHVVIESEEAVPWTLDGEFGGDQTRVEIDNLHEAMNLYLTSSKKQKKSRLNQKMQEINEVRETILAAVQKRIPGKKGIEASREIADEVMDAIAENYRTITEVHEIVETVRLGMDVQIAYADPSEDEPDPYIVRPCW